MRAAVARRGTVALAGAGTLLLLALATAPWARASIIYVCVAKKGGAVHVVSKAARCNRRQAKTSWNTKGATGARGAVSANGAGGANGAAGLNGANGVTGATGPAGGSTETGPTGATGANGSNGVTGPTGATGASGASGVTGTNGATGASGATGAAGGTGASGVAGANGATGATGATGTTGATGETGSSGATGAAGAVGGYSASSSASVNFTTGKPELPTTILTKEGVPAGSSIVYAKLVVTATDTEAGATWLAECTLVDKPSSGAPSEDTAGETGTVVADRIFDDSQATMSLGLAVTTTAPSKLTLACANVSNSSTTGSFALRASHSVITAVQTTQNS